MTFLLEIIFTDSSKMLMLDLENLYNNSNLNKVFSSVNDLIISLYFVFGEAYAYDNKNIIIDYLINNCEYVSSFSCIQRLKLIIINTSTKELFTKISFLVDKAYYFELIKKNKIYPINTFALNDIEYIKRKYLSNNE